MRFFKMMVAQMKPALVIATAVAMSACVKPQNHDSNVDDTASFYVDEVKPAMDTAETYDGFTIPKSRLYTFTACIKDRRTDEALPGAPFTISGGERDLDIHTNKDGCAVWSEKIAFDYLANEKYLPISRTITAKGSQVGARTLKLAVDPWGLNAKAAVMYDLDHHPDVPQAQLASDEQARASMKSELAGGTPRKLFVAALPFNNSSVQTNDGTIVRNLQVYLDPSMTLTDIEGNLVKVPVAVSSGKLMVTGALIESMTSGGQETKTVVSKTQEVPVSVQDGKTSANLQLKIGQGLPGSRYFLALKVAPVNAPKGLVAFEGLFAVGDRNSITTDGAASGELKNSNADSSFSFDQAVGSAQSIQIQSTANSVDAKTVGAAGGNGQSSPETNTITNAGSGNQLKTFSISSLQPTWSGVLVNDLSNRRTVKYHVRACINDLSNGGKPAAGIEFSIQLANRKWTTQTSSTLTGGEGCLEWEDQVTHSYYEPEHWFVVPVTIKHKSGYSETRQYAIDPWQNFRFAADPVFQKQWIQEANAKAASLQSYMIADGVEINTQGQTRYEVDEFLNLVIVKRVGLKIPMRVARRSNLVDGINAAAEPLRPGKYLLKAAYVAPQSGVADKSVHLAISKMVGLNRIVESRGGAIYADIEIPVSDLRLLNSRSYLVFEVKLLDEAKLPKNATSLSGAELMKYVDAGSHLIMPTFAGVLNIRNEKDSSGVLWETAELGQNPMNAQTSPTARNAVQPLINQTVDRLYAQADQQREAYRKAMAVQKGMGVIAVRANVEFAYVQNEAANFAKKPDGLLLRNNHVLPPANHAVDALMRTLNTPLTSIGSHTIDGQPAPVITRDSLLNAISGKNGMDPRFAQQLCGYFFYTLPRVRVSGLAWNKVEYGFSGAWTNLCIEELKNHGPDGVFSLDHRLRVLESQGVVSQRGRSDLQIKTGAAMGFYNFNQTSQNWAGAFGTGGVTNAVAGAIAKKIGSPIIRAFTAVLGGMGIEFSKVKSQGTLNQGGFAFEMGHGFTIEQTEVGLNVTKSDECLLIRPKPSMFTGLQSAMHMRLLKGEIGDDQAEALMNRGLMICGGSVNSQPRVAVERYYTLNSVNQGTITNDIWDTRNLPWLLQLRGQRDFASFLVIASASKQSAADPNMPVEIGDMPNEYMQRAYDAHWAGKLSTMPGMITLEPKYILNYK